MSSPLSTPAQTARPAAQRGYATLVVALAVFLAAMVVLRVPFRGYLIEARLGGRLDEGLEAAVAERWLEGAIPGVHVRVEADPSGRCEITLEELAPRADEARFKINRVARQFAEQYVIERREAARQVKLSRLQAELQTARDAEDALRTRVEDLRQQQLADAAQAHAASSAAVAIPATPGPLAPPVADDAHLQNLRAQLEKLRLELSRLLASFTDEHPQVMTLRLQIARLEGELSAVSEVRAGGGELPQKRASLTRAADGVQWITATEYPSERPGGSQLDAAAADLQAAVRARQWAERQLQTQVQTLAAAAGFPWSVEPARVLARIGGTPRVLTLLGATIIALMAASVMFWLAAALVPRLVIQSTDELASLLSLPLVAQTPATGRPPRGSRWRGLSVLAAKLAMRGAEITLAALVLALAFTMLSDRFLAAEVLGDPFGVMSEVAGRLLG